MQKHIKDCYHKCETPLEHMMLSKHDNSYLYNDIKLLQAESKN